MSEGNKQRFNAQCFLTALWMRGHKTMNYNSKSGPLALKHTKMLFGDAKTVVNDITGTAGTFDTFADITSRQAAFLLPQIRIFKTTPKGPDVEFLFERGSYTQKGSKTTSIFQNQQTRGADVGIDSVELEYLATQPAEVGNHISVKVSLFFQNFAALLVPRQGPDSKGFRWSDLITSGRGGIDGKPRPTPKGCPEAKGMYNTNAPAIAGQIKLFVGWQLPIFGLGTGLTGNDLGFKENKELGRAIRSTGQMLLLSLKNHTFNFEMDGSFTLDIEYHAAVTSGLTRPSANIFFNPSSDGNKDALTASKKNLSKIKKDKARMAPASKAPGAKKSEKAGKKAKGLFSDDLGDPQSGAESEVLKNKMEAYARIFEALEPVLQEINVPRESLEMESKQSDLRATTVQAIGEEGTVGGPCADYEKIEAHISSNKADTFGEALKNSGASAAVAMAFGNSSTAKGELKELAGKSAPRKEDVDEMMKGKQGTEIREASWEVTDEEVDAAMAKGLSGEFLKLNYFFFGHLIDRVIAILSDPEFKSPRRKEFLKTMENIHFVAGPVTISDPCDKQFVGEGCGGSVSPKYKNRSLYNMPVSLELFTVWFKNAVIKPQKSVYTFANFLRDAFGSLILPSLGPACNDYAASQSYQIHYDVINLGEITQGADALNSWGSGDYIATKKMSEMVMKNRLQGVWKKAPVSNNDFHQMVMLRVTASGGPRSFDPARDKADGVYHLVLGKGNGIIKNYSFTKNDAPYLAEAKTLGEGNLGADLSGGALYNFSCEMLGNSYFWPGQLIYINPNQLTIQRQHKRSGHWLSNIWTPKVPTHGFGANYDPSVDMLRMGGYYVVTGVKNSLTPSGEFITSIEAYYESNPIRVAQINDKTKKLVKDIKSSFRASHLKAVKNTWAHRQIEVRKKGGYYNSSGDWVKVPSPGSTGANPWKAF